VGTFALIASRLDAPCRRRLPVVWRGADEGDAGTLAGAGEVGVLGKKSVAGMDRIHAVALRHSMIAGM
jgi:hypothetical protein